MRILAIPFELILKLIIIVIEAIGNTYKKVKDERDNRVQP